jgi:hypothetical protein
MPFNQYTTCIDAQFHNKTNQFIQATEGAAASVAVLAVIPAFVAPWCLFFLIPVFSAIWLLVYCQVFLHDRLICLPPPADPMCPGRTDQVAIGVVVDILDPNDNTFPTSVDTDYSFGMLLAPNIPGGDTQADKTVVEKSLPYGYLMKEQPATMNIGVPFTSHQGTDKQTGLTSWVLHCEFEGAGVRDLMLAAAISLPLALAAFFACLFVPFPIGLAIALLLAFLSLLAAAIGLYVGQADHGHPSDENPALGGELHSGDLLVVMGTWVYDSGHNYKGPFSTLFDSDSEGWNEIHPIKFCTPAGIGEDNKWKGEWPANIDEIEAHWSTILCDSKSTVTLENQKQPENQWQVHPIIDGCQPPIVLA